MAKFKRGDRVEAKREMNSNGWIVRKGDKGKVVSTTGPDGLDIQWDREFYSRVDPKDLKKI